MKWWWEACIDWWLYRDRERERGKKRMKDKERTEHTRRFMMWSNCFRTRCDPLKHPVLTKTTSDENWLDQFLSSFTVDKWPRDLQSNREESEKQILIIPLFDLRPSFIYWSNHQIQINVFRCIRPNEFRSVSFFFIICRFLFNLFNRFSIFSFFLPILLH